MWVSPRSSELCLLQRQTVSPSAGHLSCLTWTETGAAAAPGGPRGACWERLEQVSRRRAAGGLHLHLQPSCTVRLAEPDLPRTVLSLPEPWTSAADVSR